MIEKVVVSCRVTITVEVTPRDVWGDDCQISQVREQGKKSALELLRHCIDDSKGTIVFKSVDRADVVTFKDPARTS